MTLREILCPVDFSEPSRHALRWAGALAARHRSRLLVLSVVDPLLADAARMRFDLDLATAETEPGLREFVAATLPDAAARSATTTTAVRIGNASDVILEVAAQEAIDLIVMGTHGLGGFRKWLVGSTTERVLRRAHTPVLGVPPADTEPHVSLGTGVPFEHGAILAATDFTASSNAAIDYAAQLAQELNARLLLAHVVEPVTVPRQWRHYVQEADEARVADARRRLDALAHTLACSHMCDTVQALGRPVDAIVEIAAERQAGLIVMGLAANGGPLGRRQGSIAYGVLSSASVPVLLVPPSSHVTA